VKTDLLIGNEWRSTAKRYRLTNPATEEPLAEVAEAGEAEIDAAVQAARACLDSKEWRELPARKRGQLLYRIAELLEQRSPEIAEVEKLAGNQPALDPPLVSVDCSRGIARDREDKRRCLAGRTGQVDVVVVVITGRIDVPQARQSRAESVAVSAPLNPVPLAAGIGQTRLKGLRHRLFIARLDQPRAQLRDRRISTQKANVCHIQNAKPASGQNEREDRYGGTVIIANDVKQGFFVDSRSVVEEIVAPSKLPFISRKRQGIAGHLLQSGEIMLKSTNARYVTYDLDRQWSFKGTARKTWRRQCDPCTRRPIFFTV